jgi:hypothetical protein
MPNRKIASSPFAARSSGTDVLDRVAGIAGPASAAWRGGSGLH